MHIEITFKPHIPGKWEYSLPLYLDRDRDTKKSEITLKGEAAYPKVMFDRRQIIMPVVPLGVESRCFFRIINEGFQTVSFKARPSDEFNIVPLKIEFNDGTSLGSRKKAMKVEVSFKSLKAISFTTRIDIVDDQEGTWSIYCSGTTENSLLTNCYFFMTEQPEGGYIGREKENGPLKYLIPTPENSESDTEDMMSVAYSKFSSSSGGGNLGFTPIPFETLTSHCETLSYWMREHIPGIGVSNFPDDIILEGGKQLLETLEYLTKKSYGTPLKLRTDEKINVKVTRQMKLYSTIIRTLKEQGAYLNHIRPEFLLNFQELSHFLRTNPMEHAHPISQKLKENEFKYLSMMSWSVMTTQVIKLFYLSRITQGKFRGMALD
jgi:hypothetical protein